jgi:bifunctional non-homologous end joining protein LigD
VCPFKKKPKMSATVHWVRPALACEVAFTSWTGDGHLRHPVFLGLREDEKMFAAKVSDDGK